MSKKSLVALAHGLDVQENVTRVFDMMGGAAKMIEPNSTVVLKPNAGHAAPPEFAVCTHPETVRAVIREVKKANPKRIVIAEAAAVGCDTDECYEACGIAAVAREEGVELVDIKKDKDLINVAVRGYRSNISHVKLPRLLLEAEHIINLPILMPFLRIRVSTHFPLIQCFFQFIPCSFVYTFPFVLQFFSHPSHYPVKIQFCPVTLQTPVNPDNNLSFLSADRLL